MFLKWRRFEDNIKIESASVNHSSCYIHLLPDFFFLQLAFSLQNTFICFY